MSDNVPFYLMPVAAVLGIYVMFGGFRVLHLVYKNLRPRSDADPSSAAPPSLSSRSFWLLVITVAAAVVAYGRVVASVNHALAASSRPAYFDPYELLELPSGATNSTQIKQAYRRLSKLYHPDKRSSSSTSNDEMFQQVHLAYKALTDETAKRNYKLHGHPDGPLHAATLDFALPYWLIHPEGNIALVLLLLYLFSFVLLIIGVIRWAKQGDANSKKEVSISENKNVHIEDIAYLLKHLSPESSRMEVLLAIATAPENIRLTNKELDKMEEVKAERTKQAEVGQNKKKSPTDLSLDLDALGEDGWADDDDDEDQDAVKKAKEEEERKRKEREQLKEALGKKVLLEGYDEGVIGQRWVEATLSQAKQWPPKDLGFIESMTFDYKGKQMSPVEHPAIRRLLCMTIGRLNSVLLNSHVELLEAGSKGLVDQTYFKGASTYRQRASVLLEAALRLAITARSYRLAKTLIETIAMFKIGVTSATETIKVDWFQGVCKKQYLGEAGVPKLAIHDLTFATSGENEIANGDLCTVEIQLERLHAQNWTKKKVSICQQQGIPVEVALQTYREAWWVLVRAEKIDGSADPRTNSATSSQDDSLRQIIDQNDIDRLSEDQPENQLLTAWPMVVQNVSQQNGKFKVQFKIPETPGKYRFFVDIKSQEFLGADQELTQEVNVVDVKELQQREEDHEEEESEIETKKDQ